MVGVCMAGGHAWQGGVCGRGAFVAGSVHGRGCAWQGACVVGGMHGGGCMLGDMHGRGHAWWEVCMAGEMATAVDSTHPTGMHSC